MQQADEIKRYVQQRQERLKTLMSSYTNVPKGITKHLGKYQQDVYYFGRQVQQYKETLNDPDKLMKKVLATLQTLPTFKKFMQQHSLLAGVFNIPENYESENVLNNLQTRSQVQAVMRQQIGTSGSNNTQHLMSAQVQQAHDQLSQIRKKINELGGANNDLNLPDFDPNDQKAKSILKRLELKTNIQTVRGNTFFPVTSDIGLSLGFRIDDKKTFGVGLSYKLGMGKDISHIHFTNEGISLRTFLDMKAKGSFYITGGYEFNYLSRFKKITQLKYFNGWQQSALIGVTKKYKINARYKGDIKLLFDFLYNRHFPRTQPILFRLGYGLGNN